jgi:Holliday junction resolvasome RuvABC endonuclease subunit
VGRKYILRVDLGSRAGFAMCFVDGGLSTYARNAEKTSEGRLRSVASEIERHNTPDCIGVCIEKPFGRFSGIDVMLGMFGVAVHTCERMGLPWYPLNLMTSKKHATGKGNAKKPEMKAAAKARWGFDLSEDEADAAWAGAFALDHSLFA